MEERSKIIIRKVKKKSHGGAHGGSWKVAYADFVTALMAFFLLLWLLSMVAPEKRMAMSEYFKHATIFQEMNPQSGTSLLDKSAGVIEVGGVAQQEAPKPKAETKTDPEELAKAMRRAIDDQMYAMKDQIFVDMTKEGVRIQIVDNEGSEIFRSGSDEPTEKARQIIRLVSENIKDKPNRIVIEGHTDAAPFKTAQKTNWELSALRASAARRELESNGIDSGRVARVVGYADQDLFVREDPRDPRNRRISITLLDQ